MGKWWSLLFGGVMAACFAIFAAGPFVGWWLPEGLSTHAGRVDRLYYIILYITAFFFVLTETILVVFLWQYASKPGQKQHVFGHHAMQEKVFFTSFFKRIFRPVSAYLHDQHRVELAWTLVPAVILLYIAFAQVSTWADIKYRSRMPSLEGDSATSAASTTPIQLAISARQFEWRARYPSSQRMSEWLAKSDERTLRDFNSFGKVKHFDDVHVVNELHVVVNQPALVQLSTLDVIHSLNLPHMRIKQDALPGQTIPVWFTPTKANTKLNPKTGRWEDGYNGERFGDAKFIWDIACAELCGWGHYRMIGRLYVHESQEDLQNWLRTVEGKQNTRGTGDKAKTGDTAKTQ